MSTTGDLPQEPRRRAVRVRFNEKSGFPVISYGGPMITAEEVAQILDDEPY